MKKVDIVLPKIKERFWLRVSNISSPSGCWEWIGPRQASIGTRRRYGIFSITSKIKISAHRYSWLIHFGKIHDGKFVLHRCDNSWCVNPKHLFLGTQKDNMQDCSAKGRMANQNKEYCKHGHEYTFENTYYHEKRNVRYCIECRRAFDRKRRPSPGPKTHCINGHEYSSQNTSLRTKPNGKTFRLCKICKNEKERARYHNS